MKQPWGATHPGLVGRSEEELGKVDPQLSLHCFWSRIRPRARVLYKARRAGVIGFLVAGSHSARR
jgi:hypothetical protein